MFIDNIQHSGQETDSVKYWHKNKQNPSILNGNLKWYSHFGKGLAVIYKRLGLSCDSTFPLLGICLMKTCVYNRQSPETSQLSASKEQDKMGC